MKALKVIAAVLGVVLLLVLVRRSGLLRGALRERLLAHRPATTEPADPLGDGADGPAVAELPAGVQVIHDVAYGSDPLQRFDVYRPAQASGAPVIFMVHGGGWRRGDKTAATVVEHKVAHWVPQGYILVSVNYRMLPNAGPVEQAKDVAKALVAAQAQAATWGGDSGKFVLMGHSAGAHLVALLASDQTLAAGAKPWLGTVALDSAALDVPRIMAARHFSLYDDAFGKDPAYWQQASPYHQLKGAGAPFLAVCSTRRSDSCDQAERYVQKATGLGTHAKVLKEDLSHREINETLGQPGPYTSDVDAFLGSLGLSATPR